MHVLALDFRCRKGIKPILQERILRETNLIVMKTYRTLEVEGPYPTGRHQRWAARIEVDRDISSDELREVLERAAKDLRVSKAVNGVLPYAVKIFGYYPGDRKDGALPSAGDACLGPFGEWPTVDVPFTEDDYRTVFVFLNGPYQPVVFPAQVGDSLRTKAREVTASPSPDFWDRDLFEIAPSSTVRVTDIKRHSFGGHGQMFRLKVAAAEGEGWVHDHDLELGLPFQQPSEK